MLCTTFVALLLPIAIMAIPARKPATGDDQCAPVSYTLTEYVREANPDYNFVSFNIQTSYTVDSPAIDLVKAGVNCEADGVTIPSGSIQCNKKGEKLEDLAFMLRGKQSEANYRIHHKWQCNE